MKKWMSVLFLAFFIQMTPLIPSVSAITIQSEGIRLGINGYFNGIYTYMSKMPQATGDIMPDASTFETETHLLLNVAKDKFHLNFNIEFDNGAFVRGDDMGGGDITGIISILETSGEYGFREFLQVRVGSFLTPFGIYNQIRYITPLFAPVALPMMYEPPENYTGKPLMPANANVMLFGRYLKERAMIDYNFYAGNGELGSDGKDENKDKGFGGRIKFTSLQNIMTGVSYYSVKDESFGEGREYHYGADLDMTMMGINVKTEYLYDDAEGSEDRFAYYGRLTYPINKFTAFAGYDYFKDKGDALFKRGLHRYSGGTGYTVNNYITLKAEYHYHKIDDTGGLMGSIPDDVHMFRGAAIFIF